VIWMGHRPTIYELYGMRVGSEALENIYMVNTRCQYQNSGQELLPGLQRSRAPSMVEHHHEEDVREDLEVRLAPLEQSIATLTKLVTQLLVMKIKEAHSADTEHEED